MKHLSLEYFSKQLDPLYKSIFSGCPVAEGCFANSSWEMVLVPYGLNLEEATYRALAAAAQQLGDHQLIITDIEHAPPHQETVSLPWTLDALLQVWDDTDLALFDCALFGPSGRWGGIVAQSDDGYTCLGGDQEFLQALLLEAGGRKVLKARFFEFARIEWCLDQGEKEKILKRVGWL